jgi:hypothetical protein
LSKSPLGGVQVLGGIWKSAPCLHLPVGTGRCPALSGTKGRQDGQGAIIPPKSSAPI